MKKARLWLNYASLSTAMLFLAAALISKQWYFIIIGAIMISYVESNLKKVKSQQ